jgi:flagellar hook-associated protein 3 FlgL
MDLRITFQTQLNRQTAALRKQTDTLARLQQQASTGLRVQSPSDDPVATAQLLRLRSEDGRRDAQQANGSTVQTKLDQANTQLLDASSILSRAREIATDGASDGNDPTAFETMAREVDGLIDRMMTLANARDDGKALFGGTSTQQDPFVVTSTDSFGRPATVAYQGSDDPAVVTVGQGQQVDMLQSGESIFQRPGQDVFQALIGLRDLLRNTGGLPLGSQRQALSQQVGTLDQSQQAILDSVGGVSASLESIQGINNRLGDLKLQGQTDISNLESADISQVVVQLTAQQNLLTSTLAVTRMSFDQNLLDLLR